MILLLVHLVPGGSFTSFPIVRLVSPGFKYNHNSECQAWKPVSLRMGVGRNHLAEISQGWGRDKFVAWQRIENQSVGGRPGFPVWSLVPKFVSTQSHRVVLRPTEACLSLPWNNLTGLGYSLRSKEVKRPKMILM